MVLEIFLVHMVEDGCCLHTGEQLS